MQNYQEAEARLTGRCKLKRKLENNTYLERHNGTIAVRLHNTDIITYHPDGSCILNTGGWRTPTTKDRINKYSRVNIYTHQSVWYVSDIPCWYENDSVRYLYHDGMDARCIATACKKETPKDRKAIKILKARIKKFAELCAENCVGVRSGPEDCFYCLMRVVDGQSISDTEHLESHMTEGYPVPSLIYAACKRFGASQATMSVLYHGEPIDFEAHAKQSVQKSVRRYMYEQFGLAS